MLKKTAARVSQEEACHALNTAFLSGDKDKIDEAFNPFYASVANVVKEDYLSINNDSAALAQRGYRQLTADETKFYGAIRDAATKQTASGANAAITGLIDGGAMPQTIIEDVYRNLQQNHPLLDKITFTQVSYLTRLIISDHTQQMAQWGQINSEITKEIDSSFKVLEMVHGKLTAYCVIDKDMLELGPVYLDQYFRTCLIDAVALASEYGIIKGKGIGGEPIGLMKDISNGVSVNTSTGYPDKTPLKVKDFMPKSYGKLIAQLVKSASGRLRTINEVTLICNPVDYFAKVMPASTVMTTMGAYASNVFPFPTDVIQSVQLEEGKAILCVPEEYFFGLGSSKEGNIEFSDEFKFLEDIRTIKIKMRGAGRAYDNTVAILLDISELDPAFITVQNKSASA